MQTFKPVSRFRRRLSIFFPWASVFQLQTATLVTLGMFGFFGAIAASWFAGESTVSAFFDQLHFWQENPPTWLEVPQVSNQYYLLVPTAVLFLIAQAVIKLSPQPRTWSRAIVVWILLALTIRYVVWRSLSTLNLADPLNGVFSLGLFFMELLLIFSNSVQLYLILTIKDRRREANRMAEKVINGEFTPSVDILIPTYNEPDFILRRTIIGCQAIEYANKKVYLLDENRRPEINQLAQELGCEYITRPDNRYAKAGNLNHAITKIKGELIAVFDADFVPTKNFITRTVGWFQDQEMALVQTNQNFYNPDPIARNLGLETTLTEEVEIFSSHYQLLRDGIETTVCYGSSFVVRRSYLKEIGGFVTDSLSEDYFTGILLTAKGCRFIYLDEKLSAGLSAENIAAHIMQRLRWTRGTLQAFFIDSNPLTIPGLRPIQRLAHLEGLLQWFASITRLIFLLMPLAYTFLNVIPLRLKFAELLYFMLPYYLTTLSTYSWLNKRSRSALLSDIYSVAQCFPLAITAIQVMLNPFSEGFKVTPKGLSQNRVTFNWTLALPLIILFILTLIGFGYSLNFALNPSADLITLDSDLLLGRRSAWIWSGYNLLIISISLLIIIDPPKPDVYDWFVLRRRVKLISADQTCWGVSARLSEVGAEIELRQNVSLNESVTLELIEEGLKLQGKITHTQFTGKFLKVRVKFEKVSLPQHRRLVEMLFCRPGQWKRRQTPGELRSLWLLLKVLFRPLILLRRKRKSWIPVSQAYQPLKKLLFISGLNFQSKK